MNHQWFKSAKEATAADPEVYKQAIERLKGFQGASKLKRAAINMMVKQISEDQHEIMRNVFNKIDKDKGGTIGSEELAKAFESSEYQMSKK